MTTEDKQETPASADGKRVAALEAELEKARAEAAANWDKFLRASADLENYRKAALRNADDRVRREKSQILNEMFEVMDNLDRALKVDESADLESLHKGLRMVQWQFSELLKKEGITAIEPVGKAFDPRVHEAVEHVAGTEQPEDTVVEEVRKGYVMGDETLRPARVKVSAGK